MSSLKWSLSERTSLTLTDFPSQLLIVSRITWRKQLLVTFYITGRCPLYKIAPKTSTAFILTFLSIPHTFC